MWIFSSNLSFCVFNVEHKYQPENLKEAVVGYLKEGAEYVIGNMKLGRLITEGRKAKAGKASGTWDEREVP